MQQQCSNEKLSRVGVHCPRVPDAIHAYMHTYVRLIQKSSANGLIPANCYRATTYRVLKKFTDIFSINEDLYDSLHCFDLAAEDEALDVIRINSFAGSHQCYFIEYNL